MKRVAKSKETGKSRRGDVVGAKAKARRLTIGPAGFEKISAIEGLRLSREMKRTFSTLESRGASAAECRAAIIKNMAKAPRPVDV